MKGAFVQGEALSGYRSALTEMPAENRHDGRILSTCCFILYTVV